MATTKKNVKKSKEASEHHDNSVIMSFTIDDLKDDEVSKIVNTFDKIHKDFKKNISQYYVKTSSNKVMKKGKSKPIDGLIGFNDF